MLGAFVREALGRLAAAAEPVVAQRFRLPLWSRSMTSPALMLDWLEATSSIKSIRQHAVAAKAWTRVIARSKKLSRSELASNLDHVTYDGLRLARVRLDVVSMLVWRAFWVSMLATAADDIDLYIYCDASPQKGSEYFAATVDLYDRRAGTCGRWLLPCLVLDPTLMDAMGKTFALLWQVFLTAGPQFHLVRTFLQQGSEPHYRHGGRASHLRPARRASCILADDSSQASAVAKRTGYLFDISVYFKST